MGPARFKDWCLGGPIIWGTIFLRDQGLWGQPLKGQTGLGTASLKDRKPKGQLISVTIVLEEVGLKGLLLSGSAISGECHYRGLSFWGTAKQGHCLTGGMATNTSTFSLGCAIMEQLLSLGNFVMDRDGSSLIQKCLISWKSWLWIWCNLN